LIEISKTAELLSALAEKTIYTKKNDQMEIKNEIPYLKFLLLILNLNLQFLLIPFSVMYADTSSAGVTSKAGE
jgi:hypothetical protein